MNTFNWQPISEAPQDRPILVYAPAREELSELYSVCQYHPDAGFCIDELREPTHYMELSAPPPFQEKFKFPLAFRKVRIERCLRYYDIAQALEMSSAEVSDICLGKADVPEGFIQKLYAHQLITASDAANLLRTVKEGS